LVYEKGEKFIGGEIPRICSCGAINENMTQMEKSKGGVSVKYEEFNVCASNC
jgi:hypothetical protein